MPYVDVQEEDGISPTAIREIMLLQEIQHENIVRLDSVHLNRKVGARMVTNCTSPVRVQC